MEQGPVLEGLGLPLAPVAAIVGQTRLTVAITGSQVPGVGNENRTPILSKGGCSGLIAPHTQSSCALSYACCGISCRSVHKRPAFDVVKVLMEHSSRAS